MKLAKKIKDLYNTNQGFKISCHIFAGLCFLALLFLYTVIHDMVILKYGVYTVGEYQNIQKDKKKRYYFEAVYSYQGKTYLMNSLTYSLTEKNNGEKVLIKLLPRFPKVKMLLGWYYVPKTLESPPEGWSEIPPEAIKVGEHTWLPKLVKMR